VAFPTVVDADTQNGTQTSNSSSWTFTYPTNLASGDLILCFAAADGGGFIVSTTQSFSIYCCANGTGVGLSVLAKVSDGTETGNFTVTMSANEQGGWRAIRIPAASWFGSGLPADNNNINGVTISGNGLALAGVGPTVSANPNPPSLNPANWDIEDTLWFALMAADTSRTVSAFPTTWTNTFSDVSGGAGGATLAGARIQNNVAAAVDPGTFTIS
jgi:hypothetical protein